MKKQFYIVLILMGLSSCGLNTNCISGNGKMTSEDRSVPEFTAIEVDGSMDVHVSQDSEQHIKVEAESNLMSRIITEVKDGTLHIDIKGCVNHIRKMTVYVSAKEINELAMSGSGTIYGDSKLTADHFKATMSGSGDLDAEIEANEATFSLSGSGNMNIQGTAGDCTEKISGSGSIRSDKLNTKSAKASIAGSGDIDVAVTDALDASITGSGSIYYYGSPHVNSNISGSGMVVKR